MTFTYLSSGHHRSTDGRWEAQNPHPSVAMSVWSLYKIVLGRLQFVATFKTLGELRSHVGSKTSRSQRSEVRRWFS